MAAAVIDTALRAEVLLAVVAALLLAVAALLLIVAVVAAVLIAATRQQYAEGRFALLFTGKIPACRATLLVRAACSQPVGLGSLRIVSICSSWEFNIILDTEAPDWGNAIAAAATTTSTLVVLATVVELVGLVGVVVMLVGVVVMLVGVVVMLVGVAVVLVAKGAGVGSLTGVADEERIAVLAPLLVWSFTQARVQVGAELVLPAVPVRLLKTLTADGEVWRSGAVTSLTTLGEDSGALTSTTGTMAGEEEGGTPPMLSRRGEAAC
jgi:hypothetical protein